MTWLLISVGLLCGLIFGFWIGYAFALARSKVKLVEAQMETRIAQEKLVTFEGAQDQLMAQQQAHFDETRREMDAQWQNRLQLLRSEFENLSKRHLEFQRQEMSASNQENVERILQPLRERIEKFATEFSQNREQQIVLQTAIETAVKGLMEQTHQVGVNAGNLARALKADPKKQGNWGEAVLKNILDASGLTENRDYFLQVRERDENGKTWIPDVKILLPSTSTDEETNSANGEETYIIVDSKVSISAYLSYMQTDDEKAKKEFLRAHIDSIRKHYRELSAKNYAQNIQNTAGYVLMFIPNEGSYLLAVENYPSLTLEAYQNHILIVNPTNLMQALNLVRLLWQSRRQTENVREIIHSATRIYEKFAGISENIVRLGTSLQNSTKIYDQMAAQFCQGKGNLVRQFETWKELGITTTRQVGLKEVSDE